MDLWTVIMVLGFERGGGIYGCFVATTFLPSAIESRGPVSLPRRYKHEETKT